MLSLSIYATKIKLYSSFSFTFRTTIESVIPFCYSLSELEMTRDDLLIQLYQSSEAFVDKNTVKLILTCLLLYKVCVCVVITSLL